MRRLGAGAPSSTQRDPSPPTQGVLAVLEYLQGNVASSLTVSELAKRVGISQATCHSIVIQLADAGYLLRAPRTKRYRLGPKLVGLGRAAERSLYAPHVARPGLE